MDIAHGEARKKNQGQIWVDGKLVHNPRALTRLRNVGIRELGNTPGQCNEGDRIIVRAHGIAPARRKILEALSHNIIDATCPKVLKVAGLVKKYSAEGYHIVLVGDRTHPEIIGLCGYAMEERTSIISAIGEVDCLKISVANVVVLSQTTAECDVFEKIAEKISRRYANTIVKNTICETALERQSEVARLISAGCDCIIVVGGRFSQNTKSLRDSARNRQCASFIVEDLDGEDLAEALKYKRIGIISGTSTDGRDAMEVHKKLLSLISK
jgi:4-hydroxy-3-methylbut-2-enyl diphosphate reductase